VAQRARELREQGGVQALAFNDPKRLDEVFPAEQQTAEAAGGRGWDTDD
jgi:hypothetical protein